MYNTDFLPQLEESRRHLFGNTGCPPDEATRARYMPPRSIKTIPCHEDSNSEWVPDSNPFDPKD